MDKIYIVTFEFNCSSFYFHSLKHARDFLWNSYETDFPSEKNNDAIVAEDYNDMICNNAIEGYAWIEEVNYND